MPEQLENKTPQHPVKDTDDDEIDLLELLIVLVRHKWLVIGLPVATGILAMLISLTMTPIFTSTATIMPPQQQSSGISAMLGSLGGLAGAAGGIAGLKNPNDLYVGFLESRTIADTLITRFKLQQRFETSTMDDTRKALAGISTMSNGKKDGMISVTVNAPDPQFAADLANAYVDELDNMTQTMALTEAAQRRLFFEKQLKEARDQLSDAEVALRTTQEKTGMIQPEAQVQAIIGNVAQLRGTIAAKEVQINAMRTFATGQNPDLQRAQQELSGLRVQLAKLERSQPSKGSDFMVTTGNIPAVGVEYVRSLRNVKYYETIFELLAKQFELAKIDEAKDSALIQVLDKAVPAERKSKPSRALITLAGAFAGGMLGIILAFMHAAYSSSRQNPDSNSRWQQLSQAWKREPRKTTL